MRRRATLALAAVMALVIAACVDNGNGDTTTTQGETATTAAEPSLEPPAQLEEKDIPSDGFEVTIPDVTEFNLNDFAPPEATGCYFMKGFLSAPNGSAGDILEILGSGEVAIPSQQVSASFVLGENDDINAELRHSLDGHLDFIAITDETINVALVAEFLKREAEVGVGVIHATGLTSHWRMKPGTDPIAEHAGELFPSGIPEARLYVAVVDSGIMPATVPDWMFDSDLNSNAGDSVIYETEDIETPNEAAELGASHGTFIAGLIRQVAPSHKVTLAKAQTVPIDDILDSYVIPGPTGPDGPDVSNVTTELHVFDAIDRLIARHKHDSLFDQMTALNLSLGTYACDSQSELSLVPTMEKALQRWEATVGQLGKIFAAAGNEEDTFGDFYPAALPNVMGVAATSEDGTEIVWNEDKTPIARQISGRSWVSNWAPGCDLVSLAGDQDDNGPHVVAWSGSSFATAMAAAAWAESKQATDAAKSYSDFGNPPFVDHSSCDN